MQVHPQDSVWKSVIHFFQAGLRHLSATLAPLANWVNAVAQKIFYKNQPAQPIPPIPPATTPTDTLSKQRDTLSLQINKLNEQVKNKQTDIGKIEELAIKINKKITSGKTKISSIQQTIRGLEATKVVNQDYSLMMPATTNKECADLDKVITENNQKIQKLLSEILRYEKNLEPLQVEKEKLRNECLVIQKQIAPIVQERLDVMDQLDKIKKVRAG